MEIYRAEMSDFEKIRAAYRKICEESPDIARYARWEYGKHPTDEGIRNYIALGALYYAAESQADPMPQAVMAVTLFQGEDYKDVAWSDALVDDAVAVLHLLGVDPDLQGKGIGRKMVEAALDLARQHQKGVFRLDTLKTNTPAQAMYASLGFKCVGEKVLYAENTGNTEFLFYERKL